MSKISLSVGFTGSIKIKDMKKIILLFFVPFLGNTLILYSQNNDSIFHTGKNDDFSNVEKISKIINQKLDSLFISVDNLYCGEIEVFLIIDENGKVDSCSIIEEFRSDIDSLIINSLINIDFKMPPVYDYAGNPHQMRLMLPIKIDSIR